MDIYSAWLPPKAYYAVHLFLWMLPIIAIQWAVFWRVLWPNRGPIVKASLLVGFYLCITDIVAVQYGIWFFDPTLILGFSPWGVPIEEWCFFILTALLVAQSFVLFLPESLRRPNVPKKSS